jgi:hypothetical protein
MEPRILKQKKPFVVIEAGCGTRPTGLVRKAQRSLAIGKTHRRFVGIDEKIDLAALLRKMRIKELPRNLKLIEECAIKALRKLEPGSQDVIFASYLLNVLSHHQSCINPMLSCEAMFLGAARKALRIGGRMVIIQDKRHTAIIAEQAESNGMEAHIVELSKSQLKKSAAQWIRARATKWRRRKRMKKYSKQVSREGLNLLVEEAIKKGIIKNRDEYSRPNVLILKKTREKEANTRPHGGQAITILTLDEVSEAEMGLIAEAISRLVKGE